MNDVDDADGSNNNHHNHKHNSRFLRVFGLVFVCFVFVRMGRRPSYLADEFVQSSDLEAGGTLFVVLVMGA